MLISEFHQKLAAIRQKVNAQQEITEEERKLWLCALLLEKSTQQERQYQTKSA